MGLTDNKRCLLLTYRKPLTSCRMNTVQCSGMCTKEATEQAGVLQEMCRETVVVCCAEFGFFFSQNVAVCPNTFSNRV